MLVVYGSMHYLYLKNEVYLEKIRCRYLHLAYTDDESCDGFSTLFYLFLHLLPTFENNSPISCLFSNPFYSFPALYDLFYETVSYGLYLLCYLISLLTYTYARLLLLLYHSENLRFFTGSSRTMRGRPFI